MFLALNYDPEGKKSKRVLLILEESTHYIVLLKFLTLTPTEGQSKL